MKAKSKKQGERQTTAASSARTYIDSVVEINRRHGMSSSIPQAVYEDAIRDTEKAIKGMSPTGLTKA